MSPDGDEIRAPMENSHQPGYGDKYYAKLKALERQIVDEYQELYTAMLTFTGSMRNDNGGWRCPADHLREVIDTWRPDEGRGVYHELRDVLSGKNWEYALVVEKHGNGYGHVHVAVFVDGEVSESDFHSVIDTHLRHCDIAYKDAHNYHSPDPDARPISVNRVDPDIDLEDTDTNSHDVEAIGNLGSYVGEYIGAYGEALFDRSIEELAFRAVSWATSTQLVRFSNGANEMIDEDLDRGGDDLLEDPVPVSNPDFDPEDPQGSPVKYENVGWELLGVETVDRDGADLHTIEHSGVSYTAIDGSEHLDPPKKMPPDRPQPRVESSSLRSFAADDD
ncbi:replication protein [Natrialba sp. SSL1]|nr:replication protein [Natrialba sp. SSL1]OIB58185.1 replication protein [Natrialba sp. SSL1]